MTVLFLIKNLNIGGAQIALLRLASALSINHKIILFDLSPDFRDHGLVQVYKGDYLVQSVSESAPLRWLIWKCNALCSLVGYKNLYNDITYWRLKKIIHRYRVAIIHSHMLEADIVGSKVARRNEIAHCLTLHGCYEIFKRERDSKEVSKLFRKISKTLKGIIYLTEGNLEPISAVIEANQGIKLSKIYNGFFPIKRGKNYTRKSLEIADETFVFGFVGRGIPEKGWEECINAFKLLESKGHENITLIMAGSSTYVELLEKKYGSSRIKFLGNVQSILNLISIFDVGVIPSYFESLPNTIVEFFFEGIPVIASRVGEVPFILHQGESSGGVIIELNNGKPSVKQIAEYMERYMNDAEFYNMHKKGATELIKQFSMDVCVKNHLEFYKRIVSRCT